MSAERIPGGVVHKLPGDLRQELIANPAALGAWKDITPLARNEFICWVENAKQKTTRERRIRRTQEELEEGQRRRFADQHRLRSVRELTTSWRGHAQAVSAASSFVNASPQPFVVGAT